MRSTALLSLLFVLPAAAQYSVQRAGEVIQLHDGKSQTVVSIYPSNGNAAFQMKVKGVDVFRFPFASADEYKGKRTMVGVPFMGPWANRLDEQAFYANGKKYMFNMGLGNVRGAIPSHGFLTYATQWQVLEAKSDGKSAWVTSRLEVFREPIWMAQFPFAHTVEITHRLHDGTLDVTTRLNNMSSEPMPVSIGYHPFFQLTDSPREQWTIGVGARTHWILSEAKLPTGETQPIEKVFPNPQQVALKDYDLDHVFSDLVRDPAGKATVWVKGKTQKLEVILGPNYKGAVIYAPKPTPTDPRNFICFEPMVAITNALNLAQKGVYKELQSVPPGGAWQETFSVHPTGF